MSSSNLFGSRTLRTEDREPMQAPTSRSAAGCQVSEGALRSRPQSASPQLGYCPNRLPLGMRAVPRVVVTFHLWSSWTDSQEVARESLRGGLCVQGPLSTAVAIWALRQVPGVRDPLGCGIHSRELHLSMIFLFLFQLLNQGPSFYLQLRA